MSDSRGLDAAESPNMPSRRKMIVGAAAVAWSVPAITIATATPALAASSLITITASGSHFSATNPTGINFTLVVSNTGTQPGTNVSMTVRVPLTSSGTAPTFSTLTGWTLSGTATSNGTHWVQTYEKIGTVPVGSSNVSGTVTFAGTASPYERWSGLAFSLGGTVSATNAISATFIPGNIAAVTPSTLSNSSATSAANEYIDRYQSNNNSAGRSVAVGVNRRHYAANPTLNGNATITKITATVTMSKNTAGRWSGANPPVVKNIHSQWVAAGTAHTSSNWVWMFDTSASAFAPTSNSGPGPIGPTSLVPFNTAGGEPWTPPSSRFSVLFEPNGETAGNGTGQSSGSNNQNNFSGSVSFATTSVGSNVSNGPHSRTFTG